MIAVKTIKDPSPRYSPPKMKIKIPMTAIITVVLIILFKGMFLSSIFINCDTKTELKNIATNKEEPKTIDRVMGRIIINSPIIPGHKHKGIQAATVVAVDMI